MTEEKNSCILCTKENILQIVTAASRRTLLSGIEQLGKNGFKTYSAKVNPMIAFVVGLKLQK